MLMLGTGWLTIRQAQEALKNGRLEEAHRLLGQSAAQGHKRSWELLQQVADGFVQRGQRHLKQNDLEGAWNDLLLAEQVGLADDSAAVRLRQELVRKGLDELKGMLQVGDPGRAVALAQLLYGRSVRHGEFEILETVAKDWVQARDLGERGEFNMATLIVERTLRQLPELKALERFQQELALRKQTFPARLAELHEAVAKKEWRKVIDVADQVLAAAPQHVQARKARGQAWKAIEPSTIGFRPGAPEGVAKVVEVPLKGDRIDRFLLWIDGVGGFLVCLNNRVTLGQATPDAVVDVPFYADLSRVHANLTRDGGNYLVEASRAIQINGQTAERAVLQPGDRLTLGASCQMQFTQPVPVSATARLDLVSGHRLSLAVDAVLLMADTLVMGPGSQVHVSVPDMKQSVVLFRQKEGLGVRCPGPFTIDGKRAQDRGSLGANSKVTLDECSFALEPVGTRLGVT
jgi:hypothetical protein